MGGGGQHPQPDRHDGRTTRRRLKRAKFKDAGTWLPFLFSFACFVSVFQPPLGRALTPPSGLQAHTLPHIALKSPADSPPPEEAMQPVAAHYQHILQGNMLQVRGLGVGCVV